MRMPHYSSAVIAAEASDLSALRADRSGQWGRDEKRLADARVAWLVLALVLAAILLVNPIGYSGGGRDDTRYLDAALCWVASDAVCLPSNDIAGIKRRSASESRGSDRTNPRRLGPAWREAVATCSVRAWT